ncbi:hypothetical protein ACWDN6_23655 [Streptomyces albogriseolus]|uniref:hypothetical protein n=1 Tax=Streptomyces albogriseolus TaxID=1887 RepID=UPI003460171C
MTTEPTYNSSYVEEQLRADHPDYTQIAAHQGELSSTVDLLRERSHDKDEAVASKALYVLSLVAAKDQRCVDTLTERADNGDEVIRSVAAAGLANVVNAEREHLSWGPITDDFVYFLSKTAGGPANLALIKLARMVLHDKSATVKVAARDELARAAGASPVAGPEPEVAGPAEPAVLPQDDGTLLIAPPQELATHEEQMTEFAQRIEEAETYA